MGLLDDVKKLISRTKRAIGNKYTQHLQHPYQ